MDTQQEPLDSGFGFETTAAEVASGIDLHGKTVVVTGGHGGIGLETTRVLSKAGANVVVGSRDTAKAQKNLEDIDKVEVIQLDLADPASIDRFAETFQAKHAALDVLVNNAGVMALPLTRDIRGNEMQFSTNHLGHFQLTARLWDALKKAGKARVVNVSSFGHRFANIDLQDPNFEIRPYDKWVAYGQSKTTNVLFTVALDEKGREYGIRAFALHPGRITSTDLGRHVTDQDMKSIGIDRKDLANTPGIKTIPQGAATTVWCATSPRLEGKGGVYCADCDISPVTPDDSQLQTGVRAYALDRSTAKALWDLSEKLTGVAF